MLVIWQYLALENKSFPKQLEHFAACVVLTSVRSQSQLELLSDRCVTNPPAPALVCCDTVCMHTFDPLVCFSSTAHHADGMKPGKARALDGLTVSKPRIGS